MNNIEIISKRFYKTEQDRLEKISQNKYLIDKYSLQIKDFVLSLYNKGLKLHIFDFYDKTVHIGIFPCCPQSSIIRIQDDIIEVTQNQFKQLGFENIIWEN